MSRLGRLVRRHRLLPILFVHVAIVCSSYALAFFLRFELTIPTREWPRLVHTLPLLVVLRLVFFHRFYLFSGWWRYVGIVDVLDILKSVTASSIAFVLIVVTSGFYPGYPRSVFVLDWLFTFHLLVGSRVVSRLLHSLAIGLRIRHQRDVLIVGGGAIARSVVRELTLNPSEKRPIGYLVEEPIERAGRIANLPVLGGHRDLAAVLERQHIAEVFIALPSVRRDEIEEASNRCRQAGIPFRVISSVGDYLDRAELTDEPNVEELFDFEEVSADAGRIRSVVEGKRVLVVGAGGQMGTAIAWEAAAGGPSHLLLLDRSESALYYLEVGFLQKLAAVPVTPLIADVLDEERLRQIFIAHRPDVVVHAAGYTHGALLAQNPEEVRDNNLRGVHNVLSIAEELDIPRVLVLSFDEARQDAFQCLGRAAERRVRAPRPSSSRTTRIAVRFPQVLGGPGCEVTRIVDAVHRGVAAEITCMERPLRIVTARTVAPLLLEALAIGRDGEVLALDVGRPQTATEIVRYLRSVWSLPAPSIRARIPDADHFHPIELGTPTEHSRILRRLTDDDAAPCAVSLLDQALGDREGEARAEGSSRR